MACERQNKRIATYLLSIGAHKFVRNNDGRTAFHLACIHGHKALAAWLLTLGLLKDALDHEGNNALDLVHSYGCHAKQEICNYLLSIGLQTRAVRQKSQSQPFNPSHTNLFSPVGGATTQQQVMSPPIHENPANEKESEDIATVTLVPIAMSKRSKKKFPCPLLPPEGIPKKVASQITFFSIPIQNQLLVPFAKRLKLQKIASPPI